MQIKKNKKTIYTNFVNYCVKYYNIQCLKDCLNTILGVKQSKYSFKLVKCDHYFLVEKNIKKSDFFIFFK